MEQILQYAWKYRLFKQSDLYTTEGRRFEILDVGIHNTNGGPDFFNAKIKLDNTIWAGNIEIHTNSSDWYIHTHHKDKKYDSVILNVVLNYDSEIYRTNGDKINQFKIDVPSNILKEYDFLTNESKEILPCSVRLNEIENIYVEDWKMSLATERLISKSTHFRQLVDYYTGDWNQAFYVLVSRSFGTGINSDSFERVARATPLNFLKRHIDSKLQTEAILMGQAGFLNVENHNNSYYLLLKREYDILKYKFSLKPIDKTSWQFFRLRPSAFPYLRIAVLASILHKKTDIFSYIIEERTLKELEDIFSADINPFWEHHYQFDNNEVDHTLKIGRQTIHSIIINSIAPALFAYGIYHNNDLYREKAISLLESLPFENNIYVRSFKSSGIKINNAFDSQAMIQLMKEYCQKKKCVFCRFGRKFLNNNHNNNNIVINK